MGIDFLFGILTYPLTLLLWLALIIGCSYGVYHHRNAAAFVPPRRLLAGYAGAMLACVLCTAASAYVTPEEAAQLWQVPPDKYWAAIRQEFVYTLAPAIMFSTAGIALVGVPVLLRLARAGRRTVGWALLASLAISLPFSLLLCASQFGSDHGAANALGGVASITGAHLLMTLFFCVGAGLPWTRSGLQRPVSRLALCAAAALAVVAYLLFWPVPVDPLAWQAPQAPGYVGVHAPNGRLAGIREIALARQIGPEHIVQGKDGRLYAGLANGVIMHMQPDGSAQGMLAHTGGRPLGMAFDADGNLIVADAMRGLLSFDATGAQTVLLAAGPGGPLQFANAVAVADNGKIYLTDSSSRFSPAQYGSTQWAATLDVLEQSATGRVLEFDPAAKAVRVVARGLSLANGILLSADGKALLVSESGKYRVWRIAVAASQLDVAQASPQAHVLFDNLPGYPDNLTRGLDGRIWLGLAGQRNDLDGMADKPFMRKLMLRIPRALWPLPKAFGHVVAFTEDGKVVADLQDASGSSPLTTGVTETPERLYIHNVNGDRIGWLPHAALAP